jgi:hypothetical protein
LAMIGEVSPAEMQDLRQHLSDCSDCRREYQEFVQLVLPQLSMSDESVTGPTGATKENEQVLRARFLERAQAAGISFTGKALNPPENGTGESAVVPVPIELPVRKRKNFVVLYRGAVAAGLLAVAAIGGYMAAKWPGHSGITTAELSRAQIPVPANESNHPAQVSENASAVLTADSRAITLLETKLRDSNAQLAAEQAHVESFERDRQYLEQQINVQKQALTAAQQQGQASDQTVATLRAQMSALETRADSEAASSSLEQLKIKDLTAQVNDLNVSLDRERDMLAAGRDMRDMMAARNLHIVDVSDTDSKGQTKAAFGRIFFAENRQLVFYAYDLNEKQLQEARYDYRIWGQKEGAPHTARSLGVFYSDDKTQHRWVFKCEDPKVLSEIDSVFVTLEPSTSDPAARPHGPQLMYAYLRGQPNHP